MFCILCLCICFFNRETNSEHDVSDKVLLIRCGQWLWGFFQAHVSPRDGSAGTA